MWLFNWMCLPFLDICCMEKCMNKISFSFCRIYVLAKILKTHFHSLLLISGVSKFYIAKSITLQIYGFFHFHSRFRNAFLNLKLKKYYLVFCPNSFITDFLNLIYNWFSILILRIFFRLYKFLPILLYWLPLV